LVVDIDFYHTEYFAIMMPMFVIHIIYPRAHLAKDVNLLTIRPKDHHRSGLSQMGEREEECASARGLHRPKGCH
jgi:hypothetical protein